MSNISPQYGRVGFFPKRISDQKIIIFANENISTSLSVTALMQETFIWVIEMPISQYHILKFYVNLPNIYKFAKWKFFYSYK